MLTMTTNFIRERHQRLDKIAKDLGRGDMPVEPVAWMDNADSDLEIIRKRLND